MRARVLTGVALVFAVSSFASAFERDSHYEGDSTEKLGETSFALISEDDERLEFLRSVPPLWSAVSTASGLVAGKLVACFRPGPEQCAVWWSVEKPRLVVEIAVLDVGVQPVHEIIPIEPDVHRLALEVCDPFGTSVRR